MMKKVVKLFLTLAFMGLISYNSYSQEEANKAIDLYNQAVQAVQSEDYATAITKSKESYAIAKTAEGAEETKANLEKLIPKLYLSKAKSDLNGDKYDEALAGFKQAAEEAKLFKDAETEKDASESVIKVHLAQADKLFQNNDYAGAITAFDKVLEIDTTNAQVYLLKGASLLKSDKTKEAISMFEKTRTVADATGKADIAKSAVAQLSSIYSKAAGEAQKNKKWTEVIANAEKILVYKPEDATALKLIDLANLQQGVALSAQPANKAKACAFLKKVKNDAQMKEKAAQMMKQLGCN